MCPGAKFWESKSGKQRQKYFICRLSSGSFSSLSLKLLWLGFSLIGLNNTVKFRSKDRVREVMEKFLPPPHRPRRVHIGKNISVIFSMTTKEVKKPAGQNTQGTTNQCMSNGWVEIIVLISTKHGYESQEASSSSLQ